MRTNETVRSRTLYHATLRKMLALGCAALLLLGSMLGSVVFMLTYQQLRNKYQMHCAYAQGNAKMREAYNKWRDPRRRQWSNTK